MTQGFDRIPLLIAMGRFQCYIFFLLQSNIYSQNLSIAVMELLQRRLKWSKEMNGLCPSYAGPRYEVLKKLIETFILLHNNQIYNDVAVIQKCNVMS